MPSCEMTKEKDKGGKSKEKEYRLNYSSELNSETQINRPLIVNDLSFSTCKSSFSLSRHRQPRKWAQLELNADTDRIKYRAVNFGEGSAATLPYRYAVAVVDSSSNSAQLFDAEYFVAQRVIKNLIDKTEVKEVEENEGKRDPSKEYLQSRALLGESFGTKKTKQILSSLDRNKINMDQLASQSSFIGKSLDSHISRIAEASEKETITDLQLGESQPNMDSLLPPHNSSSKKVEEIYRMQDLIPYDIYNSFDVSPLVDAIKNQNSEQEVSEILKPYSLCDMVYNRIKTFTTFTKIPNEKLLQHSLKCLLYLNSLLVFRSLNETKINGNLSAHIPMGTLELVNGLLYQFTETITVDNGKKRFKLSSFCRDKLIIYISVIILILDSFRTNVACLSTTLKLSIAKTCDYLKSVGCVVEKPSGDEPAKFIVPGTGREIPVKIAVLRAPLTIAPPRSKGNQNRRK